MPTGDSVDHHWSAFWSERAVATWLDYVEYQTKTDRRIPVFVLTPVD